MNLNGVNNYSQVNAYDAFKTNSAAKPEETKAAEVKEETGVVYEKSPEAEAVTDKKTLDRTALVEKLKAEVEDRKNQFLSYVQETIMGQGNAVASSDDVWKFLASGNFTVSEAAKKQAQEAISEDGYWGVEKTAGRILDFAKALAGDDESKIADLRKAFEKGFKEATKTWGKDLPDISNKTYEKVQSLFDEWENTYKKAPETAVTDEAAKDAVEKTAAETVAATV